VSRFTVVIAAVVLALGLVAGGLSVLAARIGSTVDTVRLTQSLDGVSVLSTVGVQFTLPMDHQSVERNMHVSPKIRGSYSWIGNELELLPSRRLAFHTTYHVTITQGARDSQGRSLFRAYRTSFTTQDEHLLYIGASGTEKGKLMLASVGGARRTLTSGGAVHDFSVSLDGTLATFAKKSSATSRTNQIWLVSVSDGSTQQVFTRKDWQITQPHLSPDGKDIVFLAENVRICRKYYKCFRDNTTPIVELLDLQSHKVVQFHSSEDVPITDFVDFSPAGQIAFTDLGSPLTLANVDGTHTIHIPNGNNELVYRGFDSTGAKAVFVGQTPTSSGGDVLVYGGGKYIDISKGVYDSSEPAFSSSGKAVAYAGYRGEKGIEPIYGISAYNLKTGKTLRLTSERQFSDWSPVWSPDDRYIAFVRSRPQEAMYMGTGELWISGANGSGARPLGPVAREVRWVI
jgi:dipeptidyl aminopeptidase/acylaminoacyl peptidase